METLQADVMGKRKTTVYLDEDILKAVKLIAVSEDKRDYEVMEEALTQFLASRDRREEARARLTELMDRIGARANLSEEESLELAYSELHAMRAERTTATSR